MLKPIIVKLGCKGNTLLGRGQIFPRFFDEGVFLLGNVGSRHDKRDVWCNAKFRVLHVAVIIDHGTITHLPPVRKFAIERHTRASSCAVAHDGDVWTIHHALDEVVGRRIHRAVGQHYDGLLPPNPTRSWLKIELTGRREVVASLARLVRNVTDQYLFIGEVRSQGLCSSQLPASIATHIDNEAIAGCKALEHHAHVAIANRIFEALTTHIANVVVEYDIF